MVGRLVENKQLGLLEEETAELQPRLFAARHGGDALIVKFGKAHAVQHGADADFVTIAVARGDQLVERLVFSRKGAVFVAAFLRGGDFFLRFAQRVQRADILGEDLLHFLENGVFGIITAVLGEIADPNPVFDENASVLRLQLGEDEADQGGFPFPVRADQPDPVPLGQRKINFFQQGTSRKAERHVFGGNQHFLIPPVVKCAFLTQDRAMRYNEMRVFDAR